ncbi:MAG: hypothetical protein LIQ30_03775 [Planctomycetes bacterium]|nr:hypothetical protein [Planctomycetota bacterium]
MEGWAAERIAAITALVESFSLLPKRKPLVESSREDDSFLEKWQRAVADRYVLSRRLEKKLDALLDRAEKLAEKVGHLSDAFPKANAGRKRVPLPA